MEQTLELSGADEDGKALLQQPLHLFGGAGVVLGGLFEAVVGEVAGAVKEVDDSLFGETHRVTCRGLFCEG